MTWDPGVYLAYADHRLRPGLELLARIPDNDPRLVFDLGCGTGHLTNDLARCWPGARVVGVDSSAEMLERAASPDDASPGDGVAWIQADLATWDPPDRADVIFSNAALHWLDDHETLFTKLPSWLTPGGILAVQMPDNWRAPTHAVPAGIIDEAGWPAAARIALMRDRVASPGRYRALLADRFDALDMWTTTYHQVLEGDDPVLTWVEGSVLRPVLAALDEGQRSEFQARCAQAYRDAYPPEPDGTTILPFTRFFMVAVGAR